MSIITGTFIVVCQIPGFIFNCYCANVFRRRLRDPFGRVIVPFLIAFAQTLADCFIQIAVIASSSAHLFLFKNWVGGHIVCVFHCNGFVSMALGIRVLINLFTAIFNYIKLLHPFTPSPMPLRKLIPVLFVTATGASVMALACNAAEKTYDAANGTCRWWSQDEPSGHIHLVAGRLMSLFSFVYLYLLPVFGTIYLYTKIIGTLRMANTEEDDDEDDTAAAAAEDAEADGDVGEGRMRQMVLTELQKTLMLDGLMAGVILATVFLPSFWRRYCNASAEEGHGGGEVWSNIRRICGASYATWYVIISLIWKRRIYRAPMEGISRAFRKHLSFRKTTKIKY